MIRTYKQAEEYLTSLIPKTSEEKFAGIAGFRRMKLLLSELENPQDKFLSVQVAGTSGKGSTSYLLSKILAASGYKTGLHLSPHVQSIQERAQINNIGIPQKKFVNLVNELEPVIERVSKEKYGPVTFFEAVLALAFSYFEEEKVDIAVVETGVGGTLDGTNVLKSKVSIITSIDFDHMHILGNTIKQIAANKAGIIKKDQIALITAKQKAEAAKVISNKAIRENVPFFEEASEFNVFINKIDLNGSLFDFKNSNHNFKKIFLSLLGSYQVKNAGLAIETALILKNNGFAQINESAIREALKNAYLPGRFEIFRINNKTVILDGAHNVHKISSLVNSLKNIWPNKKFVIVFSCKKNKQIRQISRILAEIAKKIIITKFTRPTDASFLSAMDSSQIAQEFKQIGFKNFAVVHDSKEAVNLALNESNSSNSLLITGSLYLIAETRPMIEAEKRGRGKFRLL